jgi:hypothetical protein
MKLTSSFLIFIFILISRAAFPQEPDITPYLKKIEAGKMDEVLKSLPSLKQQYPKSSSVIYLEALLTEDGEEAVRLYKSLVDKFPKSTYADDAVYRIFAYYYATDKNNQVEIYKNRLRKEYPESPYNKLTEKVVFTDASKVNVKTVENKTAPKLEEKTNTKDYKFTIQAGAFTRKENALKLKADFDKAGYTSQIIEKSVGGSLFHVVNVGKFTTEEEAKSFLNLINSKFKLQGWVIKQD